MPHPISRLFTGRVSWCFFTCLAWGLSAVGAVGAETRPLLHPLYSSQAVLQQGKPLPIWGWTTPGAAVSVRIGKQSLAAVGGPDGRWQVVTAPFAVADAPLTLVVSGETSVTSTDLLVGEVWLCSGQSNMFWQMNAVDHAEAEMAGANIPGMRLFSVNEDSEPTPLEVPKAVIHQWTACIPQLVGNFSAVAYYFGRELQKRLGVPVGVISNPYGGTTAETWMSERALRDFGEFNDALDAIPAAAPSLSAGAFDAGASPALKNLRAIPTLAFNGMLAPLVGYPLAGVVWYQGESNADRPAQYRRLLPALIADWRARWRDPKLPFVIMQLAGHHAPHPEPLDDDNGWAALMEAQAQTARSVPYCGLACAYDQGDAENIHPKVKKEVGRRLVYPALALAYPDKSDKPDKAGKSEKGEKGEKALPAGGPLAVSAKREGHGVRVSFRDVGKGLEVHGGRVTSFAIAGVNHKLAWATATIEKDSVLVACDQVPEPVRVQFAFDNLPAGELYNSEGCPAVPFRMDVK